MSRMLRITPIFFLAVSIFAGNGKNQTRTKASQVSRLHPTPLHAFSIPEFTKARRLPTYRTGLENFKQGARFDGVQGSLTRAAGTKVGETAYNYQTNDVLHDRIVYDPATKTVHTQWMASDIANAPAFADRRMRYNFFDGTKWLNGEGVPIESARAGYGAMAVDAGNIAVTTSHLGAKGGTSLWTDFSTGFGFFGEKKVYWNTDNTASQNLMPLWPDIAIDRNGTYHVIAINNNQGTDADLLNTVRQNILYWRSADKGQTWTSPVAMFPDSTTYPLTYDGTGPRAGNSQIAISDTDNNRVGILVAVTFHTLYFFESNDGGLTWNTAVNITGKSRLGIDEQSYDDHPPQYDIIRIDSSDVGGSKRLSFIEWPSPGFFIENGPIDNRPASPADLIYINGEPHVVWNEVYAINNGFFPVGNGYSLVDPAHISLLNGGHSHFEGGFFIKHWSPSSGISVVSRFNGSPGAYSGSFSQWLTTPQLGRDANGNLYCVYTQYDSADTLTVEGQQQVTWGALSFGEIWGAMSSDNGRTWNEPSQLSDTPTENERYVGIADINPADAIHILYQSTPDIPGSAVASDHTTWATAGIYHWAVPTSSFSTVPQPGEPEIELSAGILDYAEQGVAKAGELNRSFTISNIGSAPLVIDTIYTNNADFTPQANKLTIAAGSSKDLIVTYSGAAEAGLVALLVLSNNDASEHSRGVVLLADNISSTGGPDGGHGKGPTSFVLEQSYPNPLLLSAGTASPSASIKYSLEEAGPVSIKIYDMLGREIATLVNGNIAAGSYQVVWQPAGVAAGIYFYSMEMNGLRDTKKIVILP